MVVFVNWFELGLFYFSLVCHVGDVAIVGISFVVDDLDAAVGQEDMVVSSDITVAISDLLVAKVVSVLAD